MLDELITPDVFTAARVIRERNDFTRDDGTPLAYNLNISRYISTAQAEPEIDLAATHKELVQIEERIQEATRKHNAILKELGLPPLPYGEKGSD